LLHQRVAVALKYKGASEEDEERERERSMNVMRINPRKQWEYINGEEVERRKEGRRTTMK
jgi:hypothetical protein